MGLIVFYATRKADTHADAGLSPILYN